jgi:hypothetical protein
MPIVKSTCVLNVMGTITLGLNALAGAFAGTLVAIAVWCATSANAAPSVVELNPQLTPEMFSPKPSGPLQVMKQTKAVAQPTKGPKSKIVQPALPNKSKHTSRTLIAPEPRTKKHLSMAPRVTRRRALDIRPHPTDELSPSAYGAAQALPQICAPPFPMFMSPQELGACGLLPLSSLPPLSSETAIY